MATTAHIVSLFLPNTISFAELPAKERQFIPSPSIHKRARSAVDLRSRASQISFLINDTHAVVPTMPSSSVDDNLFTPPIDIDDIDAQQKYLRPGSHTLARSEAHVPEWGSRVFNQPFSRAEPLPSASIQDFSRVDDEPKRRFTAFPRGADPSTPTSTRPSSPETGYEDKTWTVEPAIQGNGGLMNAVRQVADEVEDLSITWIGTIGFPTDALGESLKHNIADKLLNEHHSEVVYCSDKDLDGHYVHYCKTILWPIFHYQVPDHPKSKAYADHSWDFYRTVNQAFADKIVASYKRGDTIWIHDYHLLLVPRMVREKLSDAKIGFFLHLGFPSSEVFRCLSRRTELLEGMLGADLVTFQTDEYAAHFLQTCSRLLTVETTAEGVQLDDHFVNVTHQPIGINPPLFDTARQDEEVKKWIHTMTAKFRGKSVIVARDKLDYVHGVRQKLLAFELFLNKYPEWAGQVVLIQVATSSSVQSELLREVSEIVTRIDSVHSTLAHQPVVFLKQDIAFSQYIALLTIADVLIISPLRDGMNLTAHDYILLQDGRGSDKKHGPLILSEFAGSATVLEGYHLSINPWDFQMHARAMNVALRMSAIEKSVRWDNLHNAVLKHTGGYWFKQIDLALTRVYDEHHQRASASVPRLSLPQLSEKYQSANCRLFIVDFEGTLAPHKTSAGVPLGSPERVDETLSDLMIDPKNIVYVMSGRRPEELGNRFRTLPAVGLIAENGCFVREFGVQNLEWTPFTDAEEVQKWKAEVRGMLEYWQERLEGSVIEERHCSLLFRYDKCNDQETATRLAGECTDQIDSACKSMRVRAVPINKAVLIELEDFSKGTAAKHIFDQFIGKSDPSLVPDFMMIAGDDREDEAIYHWANELGKDGVVPHVFTVTVGKRNTEAQASLTQGSTGLVTVLQKLAGISFRSMPRDYFSIGMARTRTCPI